MGALRLKIGKDLGLVADAWAPLWVTDFPMFEWDEEANRYVALHHPFTAPAVDDIADLRANAKTAVSRGYDMVLNGNEIGGGSIRIHRSDMQSAVFELLGIGAEEAQAKFGFLLDALKYGAPPHGGIAFGIDRIAALMAGTESIRDVIAFPKTTTRAMPDDRRAVADPGCAACRGARVGAPEGVTAEPTIRRATPDDAATVSRIAARAFTETFGHLYPDEDLQAFLATNSTRRAAGADPRPSGLCDLAAGTAMAKPSVTPRPGHAACRMRRSPHGDGEIKRLYVLKHAQNGGAGSRLFRTMLDWLERDGPRTLWIGVWSENLGAQRFYARHGFGKVGEYEFPVGRARDREFILRRVPE